MLSLANTSQPKLNLRSLGEPKSAWPKDIKSANDWFSSKFPVQVSVFGSPFLEQHEVGLDREAVITPIIPNLDCLAACLGGDERLGHRVIYYVSELQFYFYDPVDQMYHSTTPEKLGNYLRGLLARCATEVKGEGHLFNAFHTFRTDQVVKAVVNRAKSVLEAGPDFFGVKSPQLYQRLALVFAEQMLRLDGNSTLSISQTFALFNKFAAAKNMPAIKRRDFKGLISWAIDDAYGLGVRHDILNVETQKQQTGWKGLRAADLA